MLAQSLGWELGSAYKRPACELKARKMLNAAARESKEGTCRLCEWDKFLWPLPAGNVLTGCRGCEQGHVSFVISRYYCICYSCYVLLKSVL